MDERVAYTLANLQARCEKCEAETAALEAELTALINDRASKTNVKCPTSSSDATKLREEQAKLKYRIGILQRAYEKEVQKTSAVKNNQEQHAQNEKMVQTSPKETSKKKQHGGKKNASKENIKNVEASPNKINLDQITDVDPEVKDIPTSQEDGKVDADVKSSQNTDQSSDMDKSAEVKGSSTPQADDSIKIDSLVKEGKSHSSCTESAADDEGSQDQSPVRREKSNSSEDDFEIIARSEPCEKRSPDSDSNWDGSKQESPKMDDESDDYVMVYKNNGDDKKGASEQNKQEDSELYKGPKACFLCGKTTETSCSDCGISSCENHLNQHKPKDDKDGCLPFQVTWREVVGRCVLATRDIKPLELILEDTPAAIGPNYETEAVCVECLGRVDGSFLCEKCNLPICSEKCRNGPEHEVECKIFSKLNPKLNISSYGPSTISYEYGSISVLRLLSLRDRDPGMWNRLAYLMDHDKERKEELEYWEMFQVNVVDFLRKRCQLAEVFSEEEVQRAIGIFRTNAFNVERPYMAQQGTSGKGIYPTFSFLSHSCICNARYVVLNDDTLQLRAQIPIRKGEEITIQYISMLFGNERRRKEIKDCWFFQCTCQRCEDPTELGTFVSAVKCSCGGAIIPKSSLIDEQTWKCRSCEKEISYSEAKSIIKSLEKQMMDTYGHEREKYEKILQDFSSTIYGTNYQMLLLKKYLAESMKGKLTINDVERRLSFLEEFLETFETLDPGYTKWSAKLLYDICKTRLFIADVKFASQAILKEEFLQLLEKSIQDLERIVVTLQFEASGTKEDRCRQLARATLAQAKEVQKFAQIL